MWQQLAHSISWLMLTHFLLCLSGFTTVWQGVISGLIKWDLDIFLLKTAMTVQLHWFIIQLQWFINYTQLYI